ncbi:Copper chaperone [Rubrivivax sp. A210]|uniref:heavy-metal-associated domain-containing protein n=1 Tax=Rubrivivax sp. A210 TaxID=2772301 RepID=UPI00191B66F5|nr:heavy-metal-associated domain-containing protein [Rubrivivax sp. A210]CAD5371890.1 Copper chaperone [Rubrivivax sp. A210]
MIQFEVPDMTCGHCVRSVTEAVKAADPAAEVAIDLPSHRVQVNSTLPREVIAAQIVEAGFTPD